MLSLIDGQFKLIISRRSYLNCLLFSMILLLNQAPIIVEARRSPQLDQVQQPNRYTTNVNAKSRINCYSCMSAIYQPLFQVSTELSLSFNQPETFTDACSAAKGVQNLQTVECSTVCVSMKEEIELLGVSTVGHIRGCFDQMLVRGFNESIVKWYRWLHRDSCQYYNKRDVLQLSKTERSQQLSGSSSIFDNLYNGHNAMTGRTQKLPSLFQICVCYLDTCNAARPTTLMVGGQFSPVLRLLHGGRRPIFTFLLNFFVFWLVNVVIVGLLVREG